MVRTVIKTSLLLRETHTKKEISRNRPWKSIYSPKVQGTANPWGLSEEEPRLRAPGCSVTKVSRRNSAAGDVCPVTKPLLFLGATNNASPSSGLGNSEGTSRPSPTSGKAFHEAASCWGAGRGVRRLTRLFMKRRTAEAHTQAEKSLWCGSSGGTGRAPEEAGPAAASRALCFRWTRIKGNPSRRKGGSVIPQRLKKNTSGE